MPMYEYTCGDCGLAFEELIRSMSDDSGVVCPGCGGSAAKRRPSVFAARQGSPELGCSRDGACGACCYPGGSCDR